MEILEKMKEKEEERRKFREETAVAVKEVFKQKPRYIELEENYKEKIEMPEFEQQKKKLQEIRNLYQPIESLRID